MRPLYIKLLQSSITVIRTVQRLRRMIPTGLAAAKNKDKEVAVRFEGATINGPYFSV